MPKPKNPENRGLPLRWQCIHGAYYYQVPPGLESLWDGKKKFRLGKTLPESYKVWAERLGSIDNVKTIGQLLDRYALEVTPTKAVSSHADDARYTKRLRSVFGTMALPDMKPQLVYQFVDRIKAKVAAHRAVAVLSHAFTKAVEWGYIDRHPFKGEVRLQNEKPRTRYVTDDELVECLSLPSVRKRGSVRAIHAYVRIKLLTGLRRGDLLRLRVSDCREGGIHVTTGKTGKAIVYEWSDELRTAVEVAKQARPVDIGPYLFCTKKGECYFDETTGRASGWDSMWQRFMIRVLDETKVEESFTEHDLRAKCASDAETLEHARALLAHADGRITNRVYRRKPERVKPLR